MGDLTNLGKKAEKKIREWLDRPEEGLDFNRLYDRMDGWKGSCNICDFTLFKAPYFYYIESKATRENNFPYTMITDYQYDNMLKKSYIVGVKCYVVVLFASHQRAFILNIQDIAKEKEAGRKSINITKIDKWKIPYIEIRTSPSRKELLDYDTEQIVDIF